MEIEDEGIGSSEHVQLSQEIQNNHVEAAKLLIDKIDINSSNYQLFLSVTLERKEIFHHFLQKSNINLNVLNESGQSLLHQSLKCSDPYFLNRLLEMGVSLQLDLYKTILHNAVATNKPNFIEPLIKYGALMNNEDIMGMTPLDIAIENSNFEIVSMFLYYNCDTSSKCGNVSPFMYSMICCNDRKYSYYFWSLRLT
ncbi:hypothetical protein HHI36_013503 [Cryptolaemus montrouzieri]|uniref:Ankyrin repeat protein n=1 Tax=Cryptolaemus montrouzieri TaxID=559131 RepID=A0ABD2NHJ1_9CUCU